VDLELDGAASASRPFPGGSTAVIVIKPSVASAPGCGFVSSVIAPSFKRTSVKSMTVDVSSA